MFQNSKLKLPVVEKKKTIFDEFIKIRKDSLHYPNNHKHDYYTMETPADAITLIALTPDGEFLLNREYRHPTGKVLLSCPGGYLDSQEDPLDCAERELIEETGYKATRFSLIGKAPPLPGLCSQTIYYVLAENVTKQQPPVLEPSEILETVTMNEEELVRYITEGNPVDGTLCTALMFYMTKQFHKIDCAEH